MLLSLAALLCGGAVAAAYAVQRIETIYPGISADGVDLSYMGREQAKRVLSEREGAYYKDFSVTVELPMEHSITVTAEDAGLTLSSVEAAETAWLYGREGSLFENLITYVNCRFLGKTPELELGSTRSLDEDALRALVSDVAAEVNEELLKSEMRVGQYSVNIVKGAHALYIDEDTIVQVLSDAILSADRTPIVYEVDMHTDEEMDLDALHAELSCEAISSTYDPSTGGATPSQVGVTFDLPEAKKIWAAAGYGETVAIPLQITEPELQEEELNNMLYRDLLGEKTTSLSGSSPSRIANVAKACELLNTVILQPGESFDYNSCLGERTPENGWLPAPAYADGEVRDEYGGGICQVSSTLFVSALLADLQIDQRSCHYFPVGYLTAGMDATVSWGGPEFAFTNSRDYPIRLKCFVTEDNRYVTIQVWGTNTDGSYVKINFSGAMPVYGDATLVGADGNPVATGARATIWCHVLSPDGTILKGAEDDYKWFYSEYHYHPEDIQAQAVAAPPV
ncbi:MAG: hypothetical protein E7442_06810 [Ruminococcaceae bacterium]|nr:hypothetical protein [Oscillospiraceae bacterium]